MINMVKKTGITVRIITHGLNKMQGIDTLEARMVYVRIKQMIDEFTLNHVNTTHEDYDVLPMWVKIEEPKGV